MRVFKWVMVGIISICFFLNFCIPAWAAGGVTLEQAGDRKPTAQKTGEPKMHKKFAPLQNFLPDLIVSLNASSLLVPGGKISSCTVTVRNVGNTVAHGTSSKGQQGYVVVVCLSKDQTIKLPPFSTGGGGGSGFMIDSFFDITINTDDDMIFPGGII